MIKKDPRFSQHKLPCQGSPAVLRGSELDAKSLFRFGPFVSINCHSIRAGIRHASRRP